MASQEFCICIAYYYIRKALSLVPHPHASNLIFGLKLRNTNCRNSTGSNFIKGIVTCHTNHSRCNVEIVSQGRLESTCITNKLTYFRQLPAEMRPGNNDELSLRVPFENLILSSKQTREKSSCYIPSPSPKRGQDDFIRAGEPKSRHEA